MTGMEQLRELVFDAMDRRNLSVRAFAELVGVSPGTISNIRNLQKVPSPETLRLLAPVLNISEAHLLALAGHATPADAPPRPPSRDELLERLLAVDATEVPLYDIDASASPSRLFINDAPVEYAYLPERRRYARGRIKGITIRGNCLAPHVQDGDQVFIDTQAEYADGDLVLAAVGDALHLKRLQASPSGWLLTTTNGEPPIVVDDSVVMLGKYIGLWRPGL